MIQNHELDQESMQVPTLQSIVKGLIPGVEPDLTERRRRDDQDEGNAEQHNLGSLRRSYSKHHQHLGHKAPPRLAAPPRTLIYPTICRSDLPLN
jgi:hypothetical protein